ncbi:11204_t:CDS:2, partial [Gigaspora rosea]
YSVKNETKQDIIIKQTVEENGGKKRSETEEPQLPKKRQQAKKSTSKTTEPSLSDDEPSDQIMVSTARGRWTTDDDKLLSNLVLAHLPEVRWSNIARENFPERNRSSLFNRWNVIKKRLWNGGFESKGEGKDD